MAEKVNKRIRILPHKKVRQSGRSLWGNVLIFLFLLLLAAIMVLPLLYSILNSIKPLDELFAFPPKFYVVRPTMENYTTLFRLVSNLWVPFSRYLFNSIFITVLVTVASVIISSLAA